MAAKHQASRDQSDTAPTDPTALVLYDPYTSNNNEQVLSRRALNRNRRDRTTMQSSDELELVKQPDLEDSHGGLDLSFASEHQPSEQRTMPSKNAAGETSDDASDVELISGGRTEVSVRVRDGSGHNRKSLAHDWSQDSKDQFRKWFMSLERFSESTAELQKLPDLFHHFSMQKISNHAKVLRNNMRDEIVKWRNQVGDRIITNDDIAELPDNVRSLSTAILNRELEGAKRRGNGGSWTHPTFRQITKGERIQIHDWISDQGIKTIPSVGFILDENNGFPKSLITQNISSRQIWEAILREHKVRKSPTTDDQFHGDYSITTSSDRSFAAASADPSTSTEYYTLEAGK